MYLIYNIYVNITKGGAISVDNKNENAMSSEEKDLRSKRAAEMLERMRNSHIRGEQIAEKIMDDWLKELQSRKKETK